MEFYLNGNGSLRTNLNPGLKVIEVEVFPDDPFERCGYLWFNTDFLFGLFGKTDPLRAACVLHDKLYERNHGLSRKQVDKLFWDATQKIIEEKGGSVWLQMQARVYYGIVRSFGYFVW